MSRIHFFILIGFLFIQREENFKGQNFGLPF